MNESERGLQLILLAHAVMDDRPILKESILQTMNTTYDDPHTNYFYRSGAAINLCVPGDENLRYLAHLLKLTHIVYFGYNSDPVDLVPLDEVEFPVMAPVSEPVS